MSETKGMITIGWVMVLIFLVLLGLYLAKGSIIPPQLKQNVFRFMVGQETNLRTGQWNEIITDNYRIKYLPVDEAYIDMVAEAAEEAYTAISNELGRTIDRRTTILVYPDNKSLAASFGWDKDEKALGVYWGGTIRILSPQAWLDNAGQKERFVKEGPMVHEFTHLMVDEMTRGNYNRWWTEGIAQYTERKITGFEFASPFEGKRELFYYTLDKLEKDYDRLNQRIAYWQSVQIVDFIVEHYGEDQIYVICDYLYQGDSMAKAVEKALGTDYGGFSRNFYKFLDTNK